MTEKHTCPRRRENGMDDPSSPFRGAGRNKDKYISGHGLIGQKRGCSYCGSMHPDDFMQAVRDGKVVGPTDKSYKAYLHEPLTDARKAEIRLRMIASYVGNGMTEAEATELVDSEPDIQTGDQIGKFYFQHLSFEQRVEFIALHNAKQMRIGYPGYFYVAPYFTARMSR